MSALVVSEFFFFNDTATTEIYTLSLHDALPIFELRKVSVGIAEGDNVSIDSGLASGELVVVEGSDRLRDGAKVEIPDRAARAGPGEGKAPAKGEGKRRRKEGA